MDRYLATAQTDLSRSRLKSLILDGLVLVNGAAARPSHRLNPGDRIEVEVPAGEPGSLEPEAIPLSIVHEDEWLIVIDKPAGLVVHPGAGVRTGTLVHALLHHAPGIAGVGSAGRPGIVHRLDKDTSGLMVVAKQERAHRALVEAIQARQVSRVYLALVWRNLPGDSGVVETRFGRDQRDRKRMAVLRTGGKPARTQWRVLERFGVATLAEARLDTGRTHQIRVHLAHLGAPVVADPIYGGRGKKQLWQDESQRSLAAALLRCLHRQALHAYELSFTHPVTGAELTFTRPVPADMAQALELLRSQTRSGASGS